MSTRKPATPRSLADYCNLVVISDTHCGCQLALCPPGVKLRKKGGVRVDEGGHYHPSRLQRKIWAWWREFWDDFVPKATRGEPYIVIHNGDVCDGRHHGSITQISQNLSDQARIAEAALAPQIAGHPYFQIRGTEAHSGPSAELEEALAEKLGAIPNEDGQYARHDLWKRIGPHLVHITHSIGSTSSQAYEATGVHKELVESFTEASKMGLPPPSMIIRSHRHRYIETRISSSKGDAISVVTPGWQLPTPWARKTMWGRLSQAQIGGVVVRFAHDELFIRSKVWSMTRSRAV